MAARILVVEDDPAISELITFHLKKEGMQVLTAFDGRKALELFQTHRPDLILLDLMLPVIDGHEVCRRVRKISNVPIIILTAKELEEDRVKGLDLGADDYVTKPFSPKELMARIRAVLRRAGYSAETYSAGGLLLDRKRRLFFVDGKEVELTPKEFDLLALLMSDPGRPYARETLLEKVWGYQYFGGSRTLDVHVRRLRQKIGDDPQKPRFIETVHGVGYRFKEEAVGVDDQPSEERDV